MIHKKDVIGLLETIALFMELKAENPFKISAFRKAAAALETDERSLSEIESFTAISGIGKGTAAVIEEFVQTRQSEVLEELKKEVPETLLPLLKLPGLGGKKVAKLYQELQVTDMESLKLACEEGLVQKLAGFGKKTEEKILVAIAEFGSRPERLPLPYVLKIATRLESELTQLTNVHRWSRAGSLRRVRETVKDLDYIIATSHPERVREALITLSGVKEVTNAGDTKVSLTLKGDWDVSVDFRLVKEEEFATTLHHFTGSKDHNVKMRQLAKTRHEKISEYGVEREDGTVQTFATEEAFYAHFGLPWIPPALREDGTEIERYHEQSTIVSPSDIVGDLHMHTTWSDGALSLEEMIQQCIAKNYSYMAITDHSQYLKVANGLNRERLLKQHDEIERLRQKYSSIVILHGTEMDILPDATLDFDNELLAQLDFVIASIHTSFTQPEEVIMERLKTALYNPYVHMIAHPTGRLLGKRSGYPVNMESLIEMAAETGTILELNANPNRLDLNVEALKLAQEKGVYIAINTDAHNETMLNDMNIGVQYAQKAWLKREYVVNTWDIETLMTFLKKKRPK